ncbi:MAG: hypothetical protein V8R64_14465 [Thomasclavelia sp.]
MAIQVKIWVSSSVIMMAYLGTLELAVLDTIPQANNRNKQAMDGNGIILQL